MAKGITSREEDYSAWYNEIVLKAGLAEHSAVKGCMVIKPYGYAIWERMKEVLDKMFKDTGHVNAAFPLLIPKSFLSKEAAHVDGFAKECAVVTHYRLKNDPETNTVIVDPDAKLEEELIIRPTSETIIWSTYKNWIKSYRDLPLLINQWANVLRWEMRTRLFLRTAEFFWQEGHTAHETEKEAIEEAELMLEKYHEFMTQYLAMPVIKGVKSANERFAGALDTYTVEGMMQDGKALQMGTSHYLGQNFAKAFDVKFQNRDNKEEYVYATSWGVSTRMIGGLIMCHSDDQGLVLPPQIAPLQVVLVPIFKGADQLQLVCDKLKALQLELKKLGISTKLDDDDQSSPGWKFAEYEMKGVPVRVAMGMRDIENATIEIARRDTRTKESIPYDQATSFIQKLLTDIQENLMVQAIAKRDSRIYEVESMSQFEEVLEKGGFISTWWDGTTETEEKIKELTKATIRCIPLENNGLDATGKLDFYSQKPALYKVLYARAY